MILIFFFDLPTWIEIMEIHYTRRIYNFTGNPLQCDIQSTEKSQELGPDRIAMGSDDRIRYQT